MASVASFSWRSDLKTLRLSFPYWSYSLRGCDRFPLIALAGTVLGPLVGRQSRAFSGASQSGDVCSSCPEEGSIESGRTNCEKVFVPHHRLFFHHHCFTIDYGYVSKDAMSPKTGGADEDVNYIYRWVILDRERKCTCVRGKGAALASGKGAPIHAAASFISILIIIFCSSVYLRGFTRLAIWHRSRSSS